MPHDDSKTTARPPSKRPLHNKICGLCEHRLEAVAKSGCGSIWTHLPDGTPLDCFWVKAIAEHGPHGAIALSTQRQQERANAKAA
jgi:hypothetical protein